MTYLPLYTPQFAPIELWFSKIKGNLRRCWNNKVVKLLSKSSYNDRYHALKDVKSKDIKCCLKRCTRLWINLFKETQTLNIVSF